MNACGAPSTHCRSGAMPRRMAHWRLGWIAILPTVHRPSCRAAASAGSGTAKKGRAGPSQTAWLCVGAAVAGAKQEAGAVCTTQPARIPRRQRVGAGCRQVHAIMGSCSMPCGCRRMPGGGSCRVGGIVRHPGLLSTPRGRRAPCTPCPLRAVAASPRIRSISHDPFCRVHAVFPVGYVKQAVHLA